MATKTKTIKASRANKTRNPGTSATRRVDAGDIAATLSAEGIATDVVSIATTGARVTRAEVISGVLSSHARGEADGPLVQELKTLLAGSSPDDRRALRRLLRDLGHETAPAKLADVALAAGWRDGEYPYKNLLSRRNYERAKYRLQVELLKLQASVRSTGARVVIIFEGRDAAGKGGTIKRFMEHLNPRGARVVALEKPSEIERGQWYFQRYIQHLPTRGEIVLFDRSWYNRAGEAC